MDKESFISWLRRIFGHPIVRCVNCGKIYRFLWFYPLHSASDCNDNPPKLSKVYKKYENKNI